MFDIKEELKKLPQKPGVYIMKDETDNIIYIGKAVNLKNRVRQYFQSSKNQSLKVQKMVLNIKEFEYIVTDSELEALILECNLIKKHKPKYNILLKDDKQYPYIKITTNELYPRIFITRRMQKDKAKYYGPFTAGISVKEFIDLIHNLWPIRKCSKNLNTKVNERPCLNYYIGKCKAPCNRLISEQEYKIFIDNAINLLEGKYDNIIKSIELKMNEAAAKLEFEKAAKLRDKINSIKRVSEKQKIINSSMNDQDVIAFASYNNEALVQIFFVRNGKVSGREHFMLDNLDSMTRSEIMTEFIKQFYSNTTFIPKEILLQEQIQDKEIIQTWLSNLKDQKVYINVPRKGEKYELVELVAKNAIIILEQFGEKMKAENRKTTLALEQIQKALQIDIKLERIESYDISNIQGFESVASMVVFENGKPKRSDYRKFKIKSVLGPNDYASMEEVITRRFVHAQEEIKKLKSENIDINEGKFSKLPDIIFMDGGKGQINAAKKVLNELNLYIPVCGMVKDDRHRTKGLLYENQEISLQTSSEGFKLITRIQDEVHRFAIEYHRSLRSSNQLHSVLDDIDNIGNIRRKALMKKFGSIDKIQQASIEELSNTDGMNKKSAESVYNFFHKR